jgi:hypothetical protein
MSTLGGQTLMPPTGWRGTLVSENDTSRAPGTPPHQPKTEPTMLATVEPKSTSLEVADREALREEGLALEARRRAPATQKVYDREI